MAGAKGRSGGKRPGAGRKPAEPVFSEAESLAVDDPKRFLTELMKDASVELKFRVDAAKALLSAEKATVTGNGKKDQLAAAAKRASRGKFGMSAPPKLVVNNK